MDSFERISGNDIAGNPYTAIKQVVDIFDNVNISLHTLKDFETFEEVAVALYIIKYRILLQKNKDYGRNSIKKGDVVKVIERLNEKVERARNIVGDPVLQVQMAKDILNEVEDDATVTELATAIKDLDSVFFPRDSYVNEAAEDTLLDASNYADIALQLLLGIWNRPYKEEM